MSGTVRPDQPEGPSEFERFQIDAAIAAAKIGFRCAKDGFTEDQAIRFMLTGEDVRFTERANIPAASLIQVCTRI